MADQSNNAWLYSQLSATKALLSSVGDNLLMKTALENRIEDLKDKIKEAEKFPEEAKLDVWFSGRAVYGSSGISSDFMQSTLQSIVGMIQSLTRQRVRKLKAEKRVVKMPKGQFYVTALTHGSFGYELAYKEEGLLFEDVSVIDSIDNVLSIIEIVTGDNLDLETFVQENPIRLLSNLKDFLLVLKKKHSTLRMEAGSNTLCIGLPRINIGYNNICLSEISEKEESIDAVFQGAFIETGKFEYTDESGKVRHGFISENLSNLEIADLNRTFSRSECYLNVIGRIVSDSNGKKKENVELTGISPK